MCMFYLVFKEADFVSQTLPENTEMDPDPEQLCKIVKHKLRTDKRSTLE